MKIHNYALVTAGYWAFTITDGALRMLVLLHFHELGYSPLQIAALFILYEFMGILTNLLGGWVGSAHGLNRTLTAGLALQVIALLLLTLHDPTWMEAKSVAFVMGVQALSGVAKDLTKMSSKSLVKIVVKQDATTSGGNSVTIGGGNIRLFRWVAALTGSKNALKGAGFFIGAALLSSLGFDEALLCLAGLVGLALCLALLFLDEDIGRAKKKPPLRSILAKSSAINLLSMSRFFLFGARDLWFVVALPVFLSDTLGWSFRSVGAFMAIWVIGYGCVQVFTPRLIRLGRPQTELEAGQRWGLTLAVLTALLTLMTWLSESNGAVVVVGLIAFGIVFAVNSAVHSYLILELSSDDAVSVDVGYYYSANAAGRLAGTLGSGLLFLAGGLTATLFGSAVFLTIAWLQLCRIDRSEYSDYGN